MGAECLGTTTGGMWTADEASDHINCLEQSASTRKAVHKLPLATILKTGLEAPEYIRYFLQEADMRRKCLSECCTLPKLRMCLLMILFVGCVN